MSDAAAPSSEDVLALWFGALDAHGRADESHSARWYRKDPAFDQALREQFGDTHRAVAAGERQGWLDTPRGRLAAIIVLDQLSRNLFRGSPQAFANDGRARALAEEGIERGFDRALATDERAFFYMPLMHAEDLAAQDRCLELFTAWRDEAPAELRDRIAGSLKYAQMHRKVIERFGRFPHRNAVLGRASTAEETQFLSEPGSSF
jgi:uncharacterized protein (DUF924 family)